MPSFLALFTTFSVHITAFNALTMCFYYIPIKVGLVFHHITARLDENTARTCKISSILNLTGKHVRRRFRDVFRPKYRLLWFVLLFCCISTKNNGQYLLLSPSIKWQGWTWNSQWQKVHCLENDFRLVSTPIIGGDTVLQFLSSAGELTLQSKRMHIIQLSM